MNRCERCDIRKKNARYSRIFKKVLCAMCFFTVLENSDETLAKEILL